MKSYLAKPTKENDRTNFRCVGAESSCRVMHYTCTLAVTRKRNLRVWTLRKSLGNQIGHSCASVRAAINVAGDAGWVRYALEANTSSPEISNESVEHWRTGDAANISALGRSTGEYDGQRCTTSVASDIVGRVSAVICAGPAFEA